MLAILIGLKLVVLAFWAIVGPILLMASIMAFDAPGSEKNPRCYIPLVVSGIFLIASAYFVFFVW